MNDAMLQDLVNKFAQFRSTHKPHSRIPERLRKEVLAALAAGVGRKEIFQVLKISSPQIRDWQKRVQASDKNEKPRVLNIVPETTANIPADLRVTFENGRLTVELRAGG
jgi:hypothetical protein